MMSTSSALTIFFSGRGSGVSTVSFVVERVVLRIMGGAKLFRRVIKKI